jgi:hypothetical protein
MRDRGYLFRILQENLDPFAYPSRLLHPKRGPVNKPLDWTKLRDARQRHHGRPGKSLSDNLSNTDMSTFHGHIETGKRSVTVFGLEFDTFLAPSGR